MKRGTVAIVVTTALALGYALKRLYEVDYKPWYWCQEDTREEGVFTEGGEDPEDTTSRSERGDGTDDGPSTPAPVSGHVSTGEPAFTITPVSAPAGGSALATASVSVSAGDPALTPTVITPSTSLSPGIACVIANSSGNAITPVSAHVDGPAPTLMDVTLATSPALSVASVVHMSQNTAAPVSAHGNGPAQTPTAASASIASPAPGPTLAELNASGGRALGSGQCISNLSGAQIGEGSGVAPAEDVDPLDFFPPPMQYVFK